MYKYIIDCDPGHDDIMAIITALANKLNILGFTTVAGNNTLDNVTNNLLKVLDYLKYDIPVYKGFSKPMLREAEPQNAHGETGLDGPILPEPISTSNNISAIDFYKNALVENEEISIICLAPLTNIGYLIKKYPYLVCKIDTIYLMGGAICGGNINKYGEFNIYHDPEAAKIVFESGIKIVMAPLEVCNNGFIYLKEYEVINKTNKVSKLVFDLMEFYSRYARIRNRNKTSIFDLVPVVYILHPEYFEGFRAEVI